jgi:beta-glucosidase/6-phospho-beta-glucosidase/beta-galactosidase
MELAANGYCMDTKIIGTDEPNPSTHPFLFATGIENSYPVVVGKDGKRRRVDEMEKCGHYQRFKEDFCLVRELGLEYLRWGPAYYRTHLGPATYDWSFPDEAMAEMRRLGIAPIADLCHFGVPDWLENFQNPDFPSYFAEYSQAFARRYPWVRYYTPVNEIFVAASFSAEYGWWNERLTSDRAFVTALKHLARATLLAEAAIIREQPAALFVQSESSEYFHAAEPAALPRADFLNEKRFLPLDLCYGHDVRASTYEYLIDNGLTRQEYHWFLEQGAAIKSYCIMGNDYYASNEHLVPARGEITPSGEIFGYYVITEQYFDRYHMPVMHTETNMSDVQRAPAWLWKEWSNMIRLKEDGVPIVGFTWYSLTDQVDWDSLLLEDNGHVNELGLFDLDRKIRPVGEAYKKLVKQWTIPLADDSLCLNERHRGRAHVR